MSANIQFSYIFIFLSLVPCSPCSVPFPATLREKIFVFAYVCFFICVYIRFASIINIFLFSPTYNALY